MKNKWLVKKGETVERLVDSVVDETAQILAKVEMSHSEVIEGVAEEELRNLKKRKLVQQVSRKSYKISKGPGYKPQRVRKLADLTKDMLGLRSDVTQLNSKEEIIDVSLDGCGIPLERAGVQARQPQGDGGLGAGRQLPPVAQGTR